jgi:hypothetical protein
MTYPQITVAIPTLPARAHMLRRAVQSVTRQSLTAAAISIATDVIGAGAAATRQRALDAVNTEWVAFLDDDDTFKERHLRVLYEHAIATGADMVYSWFDMTGGVDPFPITHQTSEFDPSSPVETTITTLMRTECAKAVGFAALDRGHDQNSGEDYGMVLGLVKMGAKIRNVNAGRAPADVDRTWFYNVHVNSRGEMGNTSGLPTKGDSLLWQPTA